MNVVLLKSVTILEYAVTCDKTLITSSRLLTSYGNKLPIEFQFAQMIIRFQQEIYICLQNIGLNLLLPF